LTTTKGTVHTVKDIKLTNKRKFNHCLMEKELFFLRRGVPA
jgi:hypothetical protein